MAEWLLSSDPAAVVCREVCIFHFVFFSSPDGELTPRLLLPMSPSDRLLWCHDIKIIFKKMISRAAPSNGWYRVAAEGVDMNRSYSVDGSGSTVTPHLGGDKQCHEAQVVQRDLERLMASETPVTTLWSMHTWTGTYPGNICFQRKSTQFPCFWG